MEREREKERERKRERKVEAGVMLRHQIQNMNKGVTLQDPK